MRYPIITFTDCLEVANRMQKGGLSPSSRHIHWVGMGPDIELGPIQDARAQISNLFDEYSHCYWKDRDRLEGRAAPILYKALHNVEIYVLDDPGFWRYLSLVHFWDFIAWRENTAFGNGNHFRYVNGEKSSECVLTRMYLRMQALGGAQYGDLAWCLPKSTDFWRSHIIRVRTGTAPELTRAVVKKYRDDRLNTADLRAFAKRLNRLWSNVVLTFYDDAEAEQLVDELWPQ
ncbi:MAG: DUF6339 family protein [bacterium]|nr:DUF6339 family protein [bacterium]